MTIQERLLETVLNYLRVNLPVILVREPEVKAMFSIFLKKAVEQDENTFLQSIDSFYASCPKQKVIFIRYLIQTCLLINKFCALGLKEKCEQLILVWIANLDDEEVLKEKKHYLEASVKPDVSWRSEEYTCLEVKNWYPEHAFCYELLTNPQLPDEYKLLLTNYEKHFASLLKRVRTDILSIDIFFNKDIRFISWFYTNISNVFSFLKKQKINLDDLYKIDSRLLEKNFSVLSDLNVLIGKGICSFSEFIDHTFDEQAELLAFSNSYTVLVPKVITLAEFLTFSVELRKLFLAYPVHVLDLHNLSLFVPDEIKSLPLDKVRGLVANAPVLESLTKAGIPIKYLLELKQEQLDLFLTSFEAVISLYKKNISLVYFKGLNAECLAQLFKYYNEFALLSMLLNINNFFSLDDGVRQEIFEYATQIAFLAEFGNLTLTQLLEYSEEERQIIYDYYEILAILINDNSITLDTFVRNPENLEQELAKNLNEPFKTSEPIKLSRDSFIEKYKDEVFFSFHCGIHFKQWRKNYSKNSRERFLRASDNIPILIEAGASLTLLTDLDEELLTSLEQYADDIAELKEKGVDFGSLMEQKDHLKNLIFPNIRELLILLSDKSIFFSDLFKPSIIDKLPQFFKNIHTIKALIQVKEPSKVSLVKMVEFLLYPDKLNFIFKHLDAIEEIIEERQFSLTEMLEIDEKVLRYFFNDTKSTLALLCAYSEGKFVKAIKAINNLDPNFNLFQYPIALQVALLKHYQNVGRILRHYSTELREETRSVSFYSIIGFKTLFHALNKTKENLVFSCLEYPESFIEKYPSLSLLKANYSHEQQRLAN